MTFVVLSVLVCFLQPGFCLPIFQYFFFLKTNLIRLYLESLFKNAPWKARINKARLRIMPPTDLFQAPFHLSCEGGLVLQFCPALLNLLPDSPSASKIKLLIYGNIYQLLCSLLIPAPFSHTSFLFT